MRNQSGFTLIELVLVIIILGILAAVAVPRFINLSSEARTAALKGTVGGIDSASSINYAASAVSASKAYLTTAQPCNTAVNNILQVPIDTTKYTVATTAVSSTVGVTTACKVTVVGGPTPAATATAYVISANGALSR